MAAVQATPQGGLRISAHLTRSGIFVYTTPDGRTVREYRPPEEVFNRDSIQSLLDAPVTDLHPPVLVNPGNFRTYTRGNVSGTPLQDGNKLAAILVVNDAGLMDAVTSRKRTEVSCGYRCRVDETPGVAPSGEAYDRVQRNIVYNHVAIVPRGRAGSEVSLRLDGAGNEIPDPGEAGKPPERKATHMLTIRIDGQDYPMETDADKRSVQAAIARLNARLDSDAVSIAAAKTAADTLRARADTLEAKVTELTASLATANDPARMDAAVTARAELLSKALKVLGKDYSTAGKTERQIRCDAIVKVDPAAKLDKESDDYVRARFDGLTVQVTADPDGLRDLRRTNGRKTRTDADDTAADPVAARKRMDASGEAAWREPLLVSKSTAAAE